MFCYKNRDSFESIALKEFFDKFMYSDIDSFSDMKEIMKITYNNVLEKHRNLEYSPYKVGDRIGQMVFLNTPNVILQECDELSDTERGSNGFGSTGN